MSCLLAAATVAVDPGHGGRDPGAVAHGIQESDLVLHYGHGLAKELQRRGHRPILTRTTEGDLAPGIEWSAGKSLDLRRRAEKANEASAACFVSLHANASASPRARGAWVLHYTGSVAGERLARMIFAALLLVPGVTDEDAAEEVYRDSTPATGGRSIYVLRATRMPAVLVELGFLTNPDDVARLQHPETRSLVCRAIADGTEAWLRERQRRTT